MRTKARRTPSHRHHSFRLVEQPGGPLGSIRPYLVAAGKWYSEADAGPGAEAGMHVLPCYKQHVEHRHCKVGVAIAYRLSQHERKLRPSQHDRVTAVAARGLVTLVTLVLAVSVV